MPEHVYPVPDEHKQRFELLLECYANDLAQANAGIERLLQPLRQRHAYRMQRFATEVYGLDLPEGAALTPNADSCTVTVQLPEQAGEGANRPKDPPAAAPDAPSMARVYLMSGRKQWHHDIPDGWEEYAHERFDYVECGIYEKPTHLLTDEDRAWAEGRTEPPDEWVEPSRHGDVVPASAPTNVDPGWITPPAGVAAGQTG